MLLKRREPPSFFETARVLVWPRRSFSRSYRYLMLRLWRIPGTPHSIALGCAVGVFAIFTPFLGFQMMLAALLAWGLRGSVVASAIGTFAGKKVVRASHSNPKNRIDRIMLGGYIAPSDDGALRIGWRTRW